MRNVQVLGMSSPMAVRARTQAYRLFQVQPNQPPMGTPEAFDLVLAGLGGDTTSVIMAKAAANEWPLDNVYVELAMHGQSPWQAIGRRIWLDGDLSSRQMAELLNAAERSPVTQALRPTIQMQTKVDRFPRPDRG